LHIHFNVNIGNVSTFAVVRLPTAGCPAWLAQPKLCYTQVITDPKGFSLQAKPKICGKALNKIQIS
jgi:hypothetical protein